VKGFLNCAVLTMITGMFILAVSSAVHADVTVGDEAPDFVLTDTYGVSHSLSQYEGKFVVLEWLNHDCPFIQKHYRSGNMQHLQNEYTAKGVIWLSINSSAPGKGGNYPPDVANQLSEKVGAAPTAVLLDPEGTVGHLYGAKTTPHMFVINSKQQLIYQGALDDKPSTHPADIESAHNYVRAALDQAMTGKKVAVKSTPAYGCSVKY